MKNLILTMCLLFIVSLTYSQLHVVKQPSGYVGIGTDEPAQRLDVNGDLAVRGDNPKHAKAQIGLNRTGNGYAKIELLPWSVSSTFVGKFETFQGTTSLEHRGGGNFEFRNHIYKSYMRFIVNYQNAAKEALTIAPNGTVGIATNSPNLSYELHVNGEAAKPGGGMWTNASDKRLQENIEAYNMGLGDVLKLNPVYYNYNGKGGITDTETRYVGLIAQDFKKIVPGAVTEFEYTPLISQGEGNPYKKGKTEEYLSIDPSQITFMLVNGMKEQQALIEAQKEELDVLKETVSKLTASGSIITAPGVSEISVLLEGTGTEKALLAQNTPNPFSAKTRIEYFIPTDTRNARMSLRDMNGKEIKRVEIINDGIGAIELSAKDLAAGIYSYVLYVNGNIAASKKMVLQQQ